MVACADGRAVPAGVERAASCQEARPPPLQVGSACRGERLGVGGEQTRQSGPMLQATDADAAG